MKKDKSNEDENGIITRDPRFHGSDNFKKASPEIFKSGDRLQHRYMLIRKTIINNFNEALKLIADIGAYKEVHKSLAKKAFFYCLLIDDIDNRAAAILKQEALSCGAELVVSGKISAFQKGKSNAVLFATAKQIEILSQKLLLQPFGLKEAAGQIKESVKNLEKPKILRHKDKILDLEKPAIMGIINVSLDSFSGDAVLTAESAVDKAVYFESVGAQIIDLGAESSRPGAKLISAKTEIDRLIPVLKKIRKKVKIPISIDTYKYETAKIAIDEGADIINDIFALREPAVAKTYNEKKAEMIADSKCGLILMHSKGMPVNMQKSPSYKNCLSEIYKFLREAKEFALHCGIKEDFISIDPGIGFGKTAAHNLELINNLKVFSPLGIITAGVSRKRFIKETTGYSDIVYWTCANFLAASKGADIIRTHDVLEAVNVLKML